LYSPNTKIKIKGKNALTLLPLLRWTGARTTSIHRMCVIPRRCRTFATRLHRPVRLHDLEVGFGCLHRQRLCGNVFLALVLQRYEHRRCFVTLQLYRTDHGKRICRKKLFYALNPNRLLSLYFLVFGLRLHRKKLYARLYVKTNQMAVKSMLKAQGSRSLVPRGLTFLACHFQVVGLLRSYFISLDAYINYLTSPVNLAVF
jgi:hypothetical protein